MESGAQEDVESLALHKSFLVLVEVGQIQKESQAIDAISIEVELS